MGEPRASRAYYIPQALNEAFQQLSTSRAVLIEAGAGYGKTSLARAALGEKKNVKWHLSAMENDAGNYDQLCRLISEIDPAAGVQLRELGLPNRANAGCHGQVLAQLAGREEAWLVLDNFQSFMPALPRAFLSALVNHHCEGLHVVILSHYLRPLRELAAEPMLLITQSQLCLTQGDLKNLFAQGGLQLSREGAKMLFQKSQGWPVQAWLCLRQALAEGRLSQSVGLEETLDQLIWQKLSRDDQVCLMTFSFFESLTPSMLCCLMDEEEVPQRTRLLLGSLPLVSQEPKQDRYDLHQLMRNYLQKKLEQVPHQAARQACRRAAAWYLQTGDRGGVADCCWRMGDWEAFLQLDLRGLYQARLGNITFEGAAAQISQEAPDELVARYPLSMLYMAYCLYGACQFELFSRLMLRLHEVIWAERNPRLMGEWTLVSVFEAFPDLEEMTRRLGKAAELLGGPSQVLLPGEPFFFGCTSMWALFYTQSGNMLANAEPFARFMAKYTQLTQGNGSGAEEIYLGECYCVQGRFEEAEISAYRAAYLAERSGQLSIRLASGLLRGIIAVYRGDDGTLKSAVEFMEQSNMETPWYSIPLKTCMVETVRGYLLGLLLETQRSPAWAQDGEGVPLDLTFTNFMVYQSRVTDMILAKAYHKAIACIEILLKTDQRLCSAATRNFMLGGLALCNLATGRVGKAAEALDEALCLCSPDKNFTFIARLRKVFAPLFLHPRIAGKHAQAIHEIKAMKLDYAAPDEEMIFSCITTEATQGQETLTKREADVARLAAQGLRNREIAQQLYISEMTVKGYITVIFQKLQIDRRSQIMEILKNS